MAITNPTGGTLVQNDPAAIADVTGKISAVKSQLADVQNQATALKTNNLTDTGQLLQDESGNYVPVTLSNINKINAIPGLQSEFNKLSLKGLTSNESGTYFANGTLVPAGDTGGTTGTSGNTGTIPPPNTYTDYEGNTVTIPSDSNIPAGITLTPNGKGGYTGSDGNNYAAPTGDFSYESKQIQDKNDQIKSTTDALMADAIDSIKASYASLIEKQKQINSSQEAGTQNALLMGGVTGQGSNAQYASFTSDKTLNAQISADQSLIGDLEAKETAAINAANSADYSKAGSVQALQASIDDIKDIRKQKMDAAAKLQDLINTANTKKSDELLQSKKDNAVADLYSQGITDPAEILKQITAQGLDITSKEVADTINNIAISNGFASSVKLKDAMNDFNVLKNIPGGLPTDVLALPADQQLGAYLQTVGYGSATLSPEDKQLKQLDIQAKQLAIQKAQKDLNDASSATAEMTITGLRPSSEEGNIVDAATGLTPNAIFQAAASYALTGKVPSLGLGTKAQVINQRTAIYNTAGAMLANAGVDMPTAQAEYKANQAALNKILPFYNLTTAFENTAIDNLDLALSQSDQVSRTGSKLVNRYTQWIQGNLTPAAGLTKFETYIYTAAREYAKVTSGAAMSASGLTDSASKATEHLLSAATSPEAFKAAVDAMKQDMNNVTTNYEDQISSISQVVSNIMGIGSGGGSNIGGSDVSGFLNSAIPGEATTTYSPNVWSNAQ